MEARSLAELSDAAIAAHDPSLTSPYIPKFGTINPLGLSQTNFDLMDEVFPGEQHRDAHSALHSCHMGLEARCCVRGKARDGERRP